MKWMKSLFGATSAPPVTRPVDENSIAGVALQKADFEPVLARARQAFHAADFSQTAALLASDGLAASHPQVMGISGMLSYARGDDTQAIEALAAAVKAYPSDADFAKFYAGVLSRQGRHQEARAAVQTLWPTALHDWSLTQLIVAIECSLGQPGNAATCLEAFIERNAEQRAAWLALVDLDVQFGQAFRNQPAGTRWPARLEAVRREMLSGLAKKFASRQCDVSDLELTLAFSATRREDFALAEDVVDAIAPTAGLGAPLLEWMAYVQSVRGRVTQWHEIGQLLYAIDPGSTAARVAKSQSDICSGDPYLPAGWQMARQLWIEVNPSASVSVVQRWDGGRLTGGLVVHQDQGVGDWLIASRFLAGALDRVDRILLAVQPAVVALAQRVADHFGSRVTVSGLGALTDPRTPLGWKAAIGMMDLASFAPLTESTVPAPLYLEAGSADARSSSVLVVGAVFCGHPGRIDDWIRSIPPDDLTALEGLDSIEWIDLSVHDRVEYVAPFARLPMTKVELADFEQTARAIERCDLVIAIDCSVAHLSLALRKPTIVLVPSQSDWRWKIGDRESPWWPQATVIHADGPGAWQGSVARLNREVRTAVRTKGAD